jgi:hypothetical protein
LHYYRNWLSGHLFTGETMKPDISPAPRIVRPGMPSVLAWPAWLRMLAVLPAVALLWLAVTWARLEAAPW